MNKHTSEHHWPPKITMNKHTSEYHWPPKVTMNKHTSEHHWPPKITMNKHTSEHHWPPKITINLPRIDRSLSQIQNDEMYQPGILDDEIEGNRQFYSFPQNTRDKKKKILIW